jgi:hypothetical protein
MAVLVPLPLIELSPDPIQLFLPFNLLLILPLVLFPFLHPLPP